MTPQQKQAFYMAAGFHAHSLNGWFRLGAGLLLVVISVFVVIGLIKLLEDGQIQHQFRFILYLLSLGVTLMLFFTYVSA
jgi:Na+/melibiose symporter-like transporter